MTLSFLTGGPTFFQPSSSTFNCPICWIMHPLRLPPPYAWCLARWTQCRNPSSHLLPLVNLSVDAPHSARRFLEVRSHGSLPGYFRLNSPLCWRRSVVMSTLLNGFCRKVRFRGNSKVALRNAMTYRRQNLEKQLCDRTGHSSLQGASTHRHHRTGPRPVRVSITGRRCDRSEQTRTSFSEDVPDALPRSGGAYGGSLFPRHGAVPDGAFLPYLRTRRQDAGAASVPADRPEVSMRFLSI